MAEIALLRVGDEMEGLPMLLKERKMHPNRFAILALLLMATLLVGSRAAAEPGGSRPFGLTEQAFIELDDAGVNKYLGEFTPVSTEDVGQGWTKHTFDTNGGDGPICIAGTPFSVFSKPGNPSKLLIFLQGGGACWQDFYFCNILAEDQAAPPPAPVGIWDFDSRDNPFRDYSILYMPYCDGSVFAGDNDVVDPAFPFGPVRFHRGLRNQSAGMDVAKALFPYAHGITVSGSSAGGVGVDGFTPFLVRFLYGNTVQLTVLNDAGPVVQNPLDVAGITARAADWQFEQFYPASCTECDAFGQPAIATIDWRLENDRTIREAWYETDGDATNRFFLFVPTQAEYRDLILSETDPLNETYPNRYKRFIVSGDDSHTALQTPLFYSQTADGVPLNEWTGDFLVPRPFWVDIVEDFVPIP